MSAGEAKDVRWLIVGGVGGTHVSDSFRRAAGELRQPCELIDNTLAYGGSRIARSLFWRLGHRPTTMAKLDAVVLSAMESHRPTVLFICGVLPIGPQVIAEAVSRGITVIAWYTDDPWNRRHRNSVVFNSIQHYDLVLTPRRANINDFYQAGARRVEYLPFAYDPGHVQPVPTPSDVPPCDLLYVGGGDRDRMELLRVLEPLNLDIRLHGGYWHKHPFTAKHNAGQALPAVLAEATRQAKITLVLVRRENRDGHVMRSYEAAACGGCLLAEDTAEHRAIYGDTVRYFWNSESLKQQIATLLGDEGLRQQLRTAVQKRILEGEKQTYKARLIQIATWCGQFN